ncbi:MAG TPA: sugar-binding protein, partial [Thermoanaerobaculia bacterium]
MHRIPRPKSVIAALFALLAAGLPSFPVHAQDAEEPAPGPQLPDPGILHFEIERATSEIEIDGVLDEAAWAEALVVPLPYEWFPGDNVPPPVETEALVTYDSHYLYVGFRAHDPEPEAIRAHLMDRDNVRLFVQNDHVGFNVDPFNDERRAFQFRVNPFGVQVDAVFSEIDQLEDFSWDAIWASRGRITADGYVVEVAVPLEQLRFPRTEEVQTWGFEAFRSWPRSTRVRISSKFTDRDKDCTLCQENKVTGFSGIRPGLNLELDPTLTMTRTDAREGFPGGELESGDEDVEPGIFGRWGVTPNVSVSGTINPDFSQVEADAAQLEVNTRFALFFPEKRPFFLEGADFYTTPIQAVFTRTVADPKWGAKVTGKEGSSAVGAFVARDRQTNLLIPSNQGSRFVFLDDEVTSTVLRYRRDVGQRSTLGVLYTGRDGSSYGNDVYGLDGLLRINTSNAVRFQYLTTDTEYPVAGGLAGAELSGDGFQLQYDYLTRGWVANATYTDLDEDFRADLGFVPRVDTRTARGHLLRRIWSDSGDDWYDRLTFGAIGTRVEDQEGVKTDEVVELFGSYEGAYQTFAELGVVAGEELFLDTLYSVDRLRGFFQMKPSGDLGFALAFETGDAIDFTNDQQADLDELQGQVELRMGRHVNMRLDHIRQTLDVDAGELFTVDLSQLLFVYQFNVRTFVRAILQYQQLDRNPGLFRVPVAAEEEDLFTQLL